MTTITKTITFDQVITQLKKFVSTNQHRKIITFVHFDGKHLIATNSHILLRVNKDYISDLPQHEPFLYDVKNKCISDENYNYPDVSRLINDHSNSTVTLDNKNINDFLSTLKEAKKVVTKKSNQLVTLDFKRLGTLIEALHDDNSYSHALDNVTTEGEETKVNVNVSNLIKALEATKKLNKLSNDPVVIRMTSGMRPIYFNKENVFDVLVMPVRTI